MEIIKLSGKEFSRVGNVFNNTIFGEENNSCRNWILENTWLTEHILLIDLVWVSCHYLCRASIQSFSHKVVNYSFLLWYQRFWIFLLLVLCSNKLWFITFPCVSLQFMVKWFALWSQFSDGFKKGRLFIYFFLIVWMGVVISDLFTHQTKTHKYIIHHLILGIIVSAI